MSFLLAPFVASLPEIITELGIELGLSSAVSSTAADIAVGAGVSYASGKIVEEATNIIGPEKIKSVQDRLNDNLTLYSAVFNQDESYFKGISSQGPRKQTHDFKNDDPRPDVQKIPSKSISSGPQTTTRDTSRTMIHIASGLAMQAFNGTPLDIDQVVKDSISKNKVSKDVIDSLSLFIRSSAPNNDEYRRIEKVYNGRNMNIDTNMSGSYTESGLIEWSLMDETGNISKMMQTTGLIIPAIFDTFYGARSPNDKYATTLLGLYAAFHDQDYSVGNYQQGDYKLISRIINNFSRMTEVEKPYAKMAIVYFGTLGMMVSSVIDKGMGAVSDESTADTSPLSKSDYFVIQNPKRVDEPIEAYNKRIKEIKDTFVSELEQESLSTSVLSTYNPTSTQTQMIYNDFSNILIELG